MFCTNCGTGLAGGEQFCTSCGASVLGAGPAAGPQAPPSQAGAPPPPPGYAAPYPGGAPRFGGKVLAILLVLGIVVVGVAALFTVGPLGGGQVGDCVLQYRFQGIVRHQGWTRAECDQWCFDHVEPRGVALACWFEG